LGGDFVFLRVLNLYNGVMLREHNNKQIELEFVSIEELVPLDHLLRKIDDWI